MAAIGESCGLIKGSIYHYFKSKEELALECLKYIHDYFNRKIFSIAYRKQLSPKEKMILLTEKIEAYFLNSEGGCLLGNFALEISNNNPLLKKEIIAYFKNWEEAIIQILEPEIGKKLAKEKAVQIVSGTQGSIMLMRIYGVPEPFKIQNSAIIDLFP
jgi:AcrR family transcriptional regulator